jgi:hypothetical protein
MAINRFSSSFFVLRGETVLKVRMAELIYGPNLTQEPESVSVFEEAHHPPGDISS